jgi:hypothetical protein
MRCFRFFLLLIIPLFYSCNDNSNIKYYYVDVNNCNLPYCESLYSKIDNLIGLINQEDNLEIITSKHNGINTEKAKMVHVFKSNIYFFTNMKEYIKVKITFRPILEDERPNADIEFFKISPNNTYRILNPGNFRFPNNSVYRKTSRLYKKDELINFLIQLIVKLSFK